MISVGNLTLGGTGKTPMVAWLAKWCLRQSLKPVIVSRGYGAGAQSSDTNDEAKELGWQLPQVAHVQNPDRVSAARQAIDEHQADVILLDDGFQHRRLHRDLNIVLIDATQPFGYDHVFPRGTLREPIDALQRADIVVFTRCDSIREEELAAIRNRASSFCSRAMWLNSGHRATKLLSSRGEQSLDYLQGQRIAAFSGIGRPAAFQETLLQCDYHVVAYRAFNDHHAYTASDLESIHQAAKAAGAQAVVCTQKDHVKIANDTLGSLPLLSLAIELVLEQSDRFESRLSRLIHEN